MARIEQQNILEMYEKNTIRYAMEVNRQRAIPDYRDGLKTVARRILDFMFFDIPETKKYTVKSVRIVGGVLGKTHVHGDCISWNTPLYCRLDGNKYMIGDLYDKGITSIHSLGVDLETNKIIPILVHSIRIGQHTKKKYHIKFSNGYTLQCTDNHPIRLVNGSWVQAKDIKPGMVPFRKPIRYTSHRPLIDNNLIQNIVCDYYYGPLQSGYIRHHKDRNPFNNLPENFEMKTRNEHVIDHYNDIEEYSNGLELGRKRMFEIDGPIKEKIKKKNSTLMKLYSKDQNIRRFQLYISKLKERGLDITEENYETFRGEVYNLPKVKTLIKNGYGNNFEDLINLELPSIGELYQQIKTEEVTLINPMTMLDRPGIINMLAMYHVFNTFDRIITENGFIDYSLYLTNTQKSLLSEYEYNVCYQIYLKDYPIISDVTIEELETPEPMYDFTVDGYENMMIPMGLNEYGSEPMLCIHNSACYEAMVPMTNIYQSKYPLIKGQGNWGTKAGGSQAAMRYTEAGLSEFCLEVVINDLAEAKTIIDWKPNFDNTTVEPEYLAPALPLLLINGTFGIGYGIKVDVPKHNLVEVVDATLNLIKNPDADVILIPDQCMPVEIFDTNWKQICNIGHGQYKVRGVIDIEYDKDKPLVIIKSTPDLVTLNSVIENINNLIASKQLPQIYDMNDEDSKGKYPLRYVIELRRGSDPNFVREIIYKKTQMEKTNTINFEVLDGIDLLRMSYKAYLQAFIEFRKITKFRLYCARLQQYESKLHEKEIYIMLLQSGKIDDVIHKIRNRKESDDGELIEWLIKEFKITPPQAKFIINVNLKNLSIGYLNKYIQEANELKIKRQECLDIITDDNKIIDIIIQELEYYKQKYGQPRICKVIDPKHISDVPAGEFKIIITENNYIKKVPVNMSIGNFRQDIPKVVIKGDNRENILIFDEMGRVFNLPIDKIPISDKNSNGVDIRLIVKKLTTNINTIIYEPLVKDLSKKVQKYYLTMVTKDGNIKKLDLEDISNVPPSGILLMKLDDGDIIRDIKIVHNAFDIIVYSKSKALRMPLNDVPHQKRNTKGMKSMNNHDMIDGMSIITPDMTDVITITENGLINRFHISGLPSLGRNKNGSKVIKLSKEDSIKNILTVNENDTIVVRTKNDTIELKVKDIELNSSISPGKKLIPLKNDNIIRVEVKR